MNHLIHDRVDLEERIAAELSFANRHGASVAVMLLMPQEIRPGDGRRHREFGERISTIVRREDVIARFDVRTWAVLMPDVSRPETERTVDRFRALFEERARALRAAGMSLGVAIGCAIAEPHRGGESVTRLLGRARLALDLARSSADDRVEV